MKNLKMIMTAGATVALLAVSGLLAQQQAQQTPAAPQATTTAAGSPMQGCAMCSQMMAQHQEIANLTERILSSANGLASEKDPAALKGKIAEHAALIKELLTKQSAMQAGMQAGMQPGAKDACPMMGSMGSMGNMPGGMQGMQGMPGGMMMGGGQMGNMQGGQGAMMGNMPGMMPCQGANCPMTNAPAGQQAMPGMQHDMPNAAPKQ